MIKMADYEFYEDGEGVPIPPSFKLLAHQEDGKIIYARGAYGRSVEWKLDEYLNRWGWVIKKLVKDWDTGRYVEYECF